MKKIIAGAFLIFFGASGAFAVSDFEILQRLNDSGMPATLISTPNGDVFRVLDTTCFAYSIRNFIDFAQDILYFITALLLFGWGISAIRGSKIDWIENTRNLFLIFAVATSINPIMSVIYGGQEIHEIVCPTIDVPADSVRMALNGRAVLNMPKVVEELVVERGAEQEVYTRSDGQTSLMLTGPDYDPALVLSMKSDTTFRRAMDIVARLEGGYANNRADRGGRTNFGITERSYGADEVNNMTKDRAEYLMYRDFYRVRGIDTLPDTIRDVAFDMSVNSGPGAAVISLQKVLGVSQTGKVDDATLSAVNNYRGDLRDAYLQERVDKYNRIIKNNPSQEVFKKSWMRRIDALKNAA